MPLGDNSFLQIWVVEILYKPDLRILKFFSPKSSKLCEDVFKDHESCWDRSKGMVGYYFTKILSYADVIDAGEEQNLG